MASIILSLEEWLQSSFHLCLMGTCGYYVLGKTASIIHSLMFDGSLLLVNPWKKSGFTWANMTGISLSVICCGLCGSYVIQIMYCKSNRRDADSSHSCQHEMFAWNYSNLLEVLVVVQPIELKVPMCCEKCAKKVKDRLLDLEGVTDVVTDQYNQKVIVYGDADPARVLNRVKHVKKRSTFWDLTVDYTENYRRYRAAQAEAAAWAEESARAKVAAESQAKLLRPVVPPSTVVVQLPQERNGPAVTAILPERKHATPYVANSRIHSVRYVSPPKAYLREFFHGPPSHGHRHAQFYNGRHADRPSSVIY